MIGQHGNLKLQPEITPVSLKEFFPIILVDPAVVFLPDKLKEISVLSGAKTEIHCERGCSIKPGGSGDL